MYLEHEMAEMSPLLYEHCFDSIFYINPMGIIHTGNPAFDRLLGFHKGELTGRSIFSLICEHEHERLASILQACQGGNQQTISLDWTHRMEHRVRTETRMIPASNDWGAGILCIARDISSQQRSDEIINHITYHDPLTGLPNRTLFQIHLTQALLKTKQQDELLALMYIDLDRFKIINETLGRGVGDLLLKEASRRLIHCVNNQDWMCRMGSDEFCIFIPGLQRPEDATLIANRIQNEFQRPFLLGGQEVFMSMSMGISFYPSDTEDESHLIKFADNAMAVTKGQGYGNFQLYNELTLPQSDRQFELEWDMRKALDRNEFVVYYQPQVNIHTGIIIGMEALIRWNHPKLGMIPPGQFIPLAEKTGMIVQIGEWVLRTACSQNKQWQLRGYPPIPVAVNLSLRQFQQPNLIGSIYQILKETELDPQYLELEITETMAMNNEEKIIKKLNEIKNFGINISMDDFGTGYSSLGLIKKIPIDKLKIDRSFIRDISIDSDNEAIVSTIISMAHHLKLHVIAEGIESEQHLDFLKSQNCDKGQGFLFSRPVPVDEFEILLQKSVLV